MKLDFDRTWDTEEVAYFLNVTPATLHQWRYLGIGPKAARCGKRLKYLPADVLDWFRQQQDKAV